MGLNNEYDVDVALDKYALTKQELRKALLEAMCTCAREISYNKGRYRMCSVDFKGSWPKVFEPTLSDKLLFDNIVAWNLDDIYRKGRFVPHEITGIAARMMAKFYYPLYGDWDRDEARDGWN